LLPKLYFVDFCFTKYEALFVLYIYIYIYIVMYPFPLPCRNMLIKETVRDGSEHVGKFKSRDMLMYLLSFM